MCPRLFGSPSDTSRIRKLQVGVEPRLALVVGSKSTLTTIETTLRDRFNSLFGRTDIYQDDDSSADLTNYDVIACMPSITDANALVATFGDLDVPIISFKGSFSDDELLLSTTNGTSASETTTNIVTTAHNITRAQTTGTNTIYSSASAVDYLGTLAGGAVSLCRDVTTATEIHITTIKEGDSLTGGIDAPEARVHFGLKTLNVLNSTGLELLDAALQYLLWGSRVHVSVEVDVEEALSSLVEFGTSGKILPLGEPVGVAIFVDASVTTSGNGLTWTNALKTIAEADAKCTTDQGDYVFINAGSYNENAATTGISISKDDCHYIGMGGVQCILQNSNAGATYVIYLNSVESVEISYLFIDEGTNTVEGIYVNGGSDNCLHNNYFTGTMENNIQLSGSGRTVISNNRMDSATNDGIEVSGSNLRSNIHNNYIANIGDNGINLNGDSVDRNFIFNNHINGTAGTTDYAVQILLGDNNMIANNWFGECGTWPNNDTGSNNVWVDNKADMGDSAIARVNADAVAEDTADFTNIDLWTSGLFEVTMDMSNCSDGGTWTLRLYEKIDESTFEEVDYDTFLVGTDVINCRVRGAFEGGSNKLQVSHQSSTAVAASRTIDLKVRCIGQ